MKKYNHVLVVPEVELIAAVYLADEADAEIATKQAEIATKQAEIDEQKKLLTDILESDKWWRDDDLMDRLYKATGKRA